MKQPGRGVQCPTWAAATIQLQGVGREAVPSAMGGIDEEETADDRVRTLCVQPEQDNQGLNELYKR